MVCSTDRSKAVVLVLVLLFVALWFILQGDLFYVLPCVILFLCFSVIIALQLPHLGKRENSVFRTALPGLFSYLFFLPDILRKRVREKSRECHNHKPQPFPDTKRKRKQTNPNKHKSKKKRTKSTNISSLFPK